MCPDLNEPNVSACSPALQRLFIFPKAESFRHTLSSLAQMIENLPEMQYLGQGEGNGNPLQYSCLESPWTEDPGGLESMGLQRVGHNSSNFHCTKCTLKALGVVTSGHSSLERITVFSVDCKLAPHPRHIQSLILYQ